MAARCCFLPGPPASSPAPRACLRLCRGSRHLGPNPAEPALFPSHPGNPPFPWFLPVPSPRVFREMGQTFQPPACPSVFPLVLPSSLSPPPSPRPDSLPHFPLKLFSGTCWDRAPGFWSYRLQLCLLSVGVGHVGRICFDLLLQASSPLHPHPEGAGWG